MFTFLDEEQLTFCFAFLKTAAEQVLSLVTCSGMAPADHRAVMVCTIAEETPASGSGVASE